MSSHGNMWKYVAELSTDFDPALPLVTCLPGEFNQVILNIIVNAAHAVADVLDEASGEKGAITISTRATGRLGRDSYCGYGRRHARGRQGAYF